MQYAIFCYNQEAEVGRWTQEQDDEVMARHQKVIQDLAARGKMGPVARLQPTTTATTVRSGNIKATFDGPFAETKEQLLGFYIVDCDSAEEAAEIARQFVEAPGCMEIRPVRNFFPGPSA
ncbi:MAG TPA: YciI family protein [Povalibacter sp.]|uniref:YciI family protein n=1 Tax=Povalibacter sp. TaxID=1962978 RepID=UPI002C1F0180|nr:YciI family protein [Povalibacter sp.]HMN43870.1 YciI family protein [Povalibacter sp.]